jgi:hypothetical protein
MRTRESIRMLERADEVMSSSLDETYPKTEKELYEWLAEASRLRLLANRTTRRITKILDRMDPARVEARFSWYRNFATPYERVQLQKAMMRQIRSSARQA